MLGACVSLASAAQFMELLYLINITNSPYTYYGYANAMSIITFSFIPNLPLFLLPATITKESTPENSIDPPFSYNRYFKGNAFITNIGNILSFYVIIGIYALLCTLLKGKIQFFENKSKGIPNVLIQSAVIHFNQIMVTAIFQLKNIISLTDSYFLSSTILAGASIIGNVNFVLFAVKIIKKSEGNRNEIFDETFGGLYLDYNNNHKLSKYTLVGSLVKRTVVTSILVMFAKYPSIELGAIATISIGTLGMMLYYRPYVKRNELFNNVISEFSTSMVLVIDCLLNFGINLSTELRSTLGTAVVSIFAIGTSLMSIGSLYETAKDVTSYFKNIVKSNFAPIAPQPKEISASIDLSI